MSLVEVVEADTATVSDQSYPAEAPAVDAVDIALIDSNVVITDTQVYKPTEHSYASEHDQAMTLSQDLELNGGIAATEAYALAKHGFASDQDQAMTLSQDLETDGVIAATQAHALDEHDNANDQDQAMTLCST